MAIWNQRRFSDRDTATALWLPKGTLPRTYVVSSYWDILDEAIPEKIQQVVTEARRTKFEMIMMMDSNAHTTLTGSESSNKRGKLLEQFIISNGLEIINQGTDLTYESPLGKSRIDITLATPGIAQHLHKWRVNNELNHSDHHTIEFNIKTLEPTRSFKRNFKKLNLPEF